MGLLNSRGASTRLPERKRLAKRYHDDLKSRLSRLPILLRRVVDASMLILTLDVSLRTGWPQSRRAIGPPQTPGPRTGIDNLGTGNRAPHGFGQPWGGTWDKEPLSAGAAAAPLGRGLPTPAGIYPAELNPA
jgi:hypothetical protein